MAAEESKVSIVTWPKEALKLSHEFAEGKPCPVAIAFAPETPAHVVVGTDPKQPLDVNMSMSVSARQPVPLCISLCEPICARSDYTIGIAIFDNPFASITIRGLTRLFNCKEEPPAQATCIGFDALKPPTEFPAPFTHENLRFTPLAEPLHAATFGDPAGKVKLRFPRAGLRITFPFPVRDVRITVNNYAGPTIDFAAFAGTTLLASFSEPIANTVKQVTLAQTGITDVEIKGGNNEAGVVEVCYAPAAKR
ncbi:MAG: hypothetical protein MUF79_09150 [Burkholderiales bacterium]|jgi:hypothetical protein|nr:hypothetical protein [Burkholderiales bacterium]